MDLKKPFLFFKDLHKNQNYSDGSPYWPHLLRVGDILQYYLDLFKECDKKTIYSIIVAGYGHDSMEDTPVTKKELEKQFDKYIAELIFGMTNEENDLHTNKYVKKVTTGSEEIRLIKLADMCDNYQGMIYKTNNKKIAKFFKKDILPIIEPMYQEIITTKFHIYVKTSKHLLSDAKKFHDLVISIIDKLLDS